MAIWLQCIGAVCLLSSRVSLATRLDKYVSPLPSAVDEMESMFRSNFVANIRVWQEFALHLEIPSMAAIFLETISSAFIRDEPLLLCTIVSAHSPPVPVLLPPHAPRFMSYVTIQTFGRPNASVAQGRSTRWKHWRPKTLKSSTSR